MALGCIISRPAWLNGRLHVIGCQQREWCNNLSLLGEQRERILQTDTGGCDRSALS